MSALDDPTWRAASHGSGERRFGVARFGGREWAEGPGGKTRRFGNITAAQRAADQLNAEAAA